MFPASSQVVVTDIIEVGLFCLSVQWVTLGVDDSVGSDNLRVSVDLVSLRTYTVWRGVDFDNLEIYGPHTTTNLKDIAWNQQKMQSLTHLFGQVGKPPKSRVGGRHQRGFRIDLLSVHGYVVVGLRSLPSMESPKGKT